MQEPRVRTLKYENPGSEAEFELYLEGVKVPFSGAQVSESERGMPTASVSFPADPGVLKVLPGTIVQIFGPAVVNNPVVVKGEETSTKQAENILLFEGEVSGISYSKSTSGRVANLMCESLLNSLTRATVQPVDSIAPTHITNALGSNRVTFYKNTKVVASRGTRAEEILDTLNEGEAEPTINNLQSNAGGIAQTFMELLDKEGPQVGDYTEMFNILYDYFMRYDLFFNILSKSFKLDASFFAMPNCPAGNEGFRIQLMQAVLQNMNSAKGYDVDVRTMTLTDVYSSLLQLLHYRLLTPAAYPAVSRFYVTDPEEDKTKLHPLRAIMGPNFDYAPPPKANIFFPNQVSDFAYHRNASDEKTRVVMQGE